jgi:Hint domain
VSQNDLGVAALVGTPITARSFSTVTFTAEVGSGVNGNGVNYDSNGDVAGDTNWQTETGAEPWIENNGANALTYTIVAASNDQQVVTFQVTGGSLSTPLTIYGQVVGWNNAVILFNGFTDAALTQPLSGPSSSFILSEQKLPPDGIPTNASSIGGSTNTPFGLTIFAAPSCFARGTSLLTPSGPRLVEDLADGDLVLTASGQAQPVQWAGRSHVQCSSHRQPGRVMPVRVAAGAFGPGLPERDLFLSPEHAVFHGDAMIPVHCLVNGATIRQVPVDSIVYYHVELARHDVLFAEGLPTESYLETGNRSAMARAA